MDWEKLSACGIDYENGIRRCMGDEHLYRTLLSMFLEDDTIARSEQARQARDGEALFSSMHELKGMCGNMAMRGLYDEVCLLVELLRPGAADWGAADALFARVRSVYAETVREVAEFLSR